MIILIYVKNAIVIIIARVKKKVICIFPQNRYKEFHEKIIKSYFNIWYIKFFYLLQKNIKLNKNIYNISILMNIFMNLYDNSGIDCNKKIKIKYMICIMILFLVNSFIVINIKIALYLLFINKVILLLIHVRSLVVLRSKELVLCTLITSVFHALLSNK